MDYLFSDYIKLYSEIEENEWITVFEENAERNCENDIFTFCAILKANPTELQEYVSKYDWGFEPDTFGKTTFYQYGYGEPEYFSDESKDEFEYLVALRYFDKYPKIYEINPKLIWYHNLRLEGQEYRDPKTGDVEIKLADHKIDIRLSYLKDFLAANGSYLSIVFDHRRYFKRDVISTKDNYRVYLEKNMYIYWALNAVDALSEDAKKYDYYSSIIGKAIIEPYKRPRHEAYRYFTDKERYEKFVIELDENGDDIEFECNESKLANNFGSNPDSPHFLTPTYFSIKVLDKYKADPRNYEVKDSDIIYLNEWSIPFCINEDRKVVVWLGDLGRIPYKEQQYWKAFNESPKGKMEDKFLARQLLNHWTDGSRIESNLIRSLKIANDYSIKQYGDVIFLQLSEADAEIYRSFVLPTNLSIPEYQQFLMKLCKLTAESINTKLLKKVMGDTLDSSKGSIAQLDDFLKFINIDKNGKVYASIKKAYDSRNKLAGHRASTSEYNKVWKRDVSTEINTVDDATILLNEIISAINEVFE